MFGGNPSKKNRKPSPGRDKPHDSGDSEKSGQGARGGDASGIAGQSGLAYREDDPKQPKNNPPKKSGKS